MLHISWSQIAGFIPTSVRYLILVYDVVLYIAGLKVSAGVDAGLDLGYELILEPSEAVGTLNFASGSWNFHAAALMTLSVETQMSFIVCLDWDITHEPSRESSVLCYT